MIGRLTVSTLAILLFAVAPLRGESRAAGITTPPRTAQVITGSDFLSATTGWIAVSRSAAYVPNGPCDRGTARGCDTARTVIYRTDNSGRQWTRQIALTTVSGPSLWIHFFSRQTGVVAATVRAAGSLSSNDGTRSVLLRTIDGGRRWDRVTLPRGYIVDGHTIAFPDARHGWLWLGQGAMGSMEVEMYSTSDAGSHWTRIACTQVSTVASQCPFHSGIPLAGDKEFLAFPNTHAGWLTIISNTGIPTLLHSQDGGRVWQNQHIGLPPGATRTGSKDTAFPMGTFEAPHLFGRSGVLAEIVGFYGSRSGASSQRLYLFRSQDAGGTWRFYERAPVPVPTLDVHLDAYLDALHWVYIAHNSAWRTDNGGKSWSHAALHVPPGQQLVTLALMDRQHWWAEAARASQSDNPDGHVMLLRTADSGHSWTSVPIPSTASR